MSAPEEREQNWYPVSQVGWFTAHIREGIAVTGLTEARWVRAIETRPGTVKGRKITHHAIARLQQTETDPLAANDVDPATGAQQAGTVDKFRVRVTQAGGVGAHMLMTQGKAQVRRLHWPQHGIYGWHDTPSS